MVHAEIEPDHQILIFDLLTVEEFGKVLLRSRGQIRVLYAVREYLVVMLA